MDIDDFEEYTGLTLTEVQRDQFEPMSRRAQKRLQKILGWEILSSDDYNEVGQLLNHCSPIDQKTLDKTKLKEPDEVINTWRLFPYYDTNVNLRIDPCTAVNNAKLVIPLIGDETEFVTIYNLSKYVPLAGKTVGGKQYINYIKKSKDPCPCMKWITNVPLLAVDAEWVSDFWPDDLMEVLADLIVYEYQSKPSLTADSSRPLKSMSQSVDGHSVSKTYADSDKLSSNDPLEKDSVKDILMEYIGPYSPLYKERRIY